MHKPIRIDFIAMDGTPELRGAIERHLAKLLERQGPVRGCHVAIKAPGPHQRGGRYEVSLRLAPAEGPEVVVGAPPRDDARHADLDFAIDDAFRRARRRLQDQARRLREGAGKRKSRPERDASAASAGSAETGFAAPRDERATGETAQAVKAPVERKRASAPAGKSAGKRRSPPQAEPAPAPSPAPPEADGASAPTQPLPASASEPAVPVAVAAPAAATPPAAPVDVAASQAPPPAEPAGQALLDPADTGSSLAEPAVAEPPADLRAPTLAEPRVEPPAFVTAEAEPPSVEPPGFVTAEAESPSVEPSGAEPVPIEPALRAPESAEDKGAPAVAATLNPAAPVPGAGPTLSDLDTLSRSFAAAAVAKSIERLEPSISASMTNIAPLSFAMALTFMKTAAALNAASTTWMHSYFACLGSMMQPPPAAAKAKDGES
jgi:hypothetical protein